MLSVINCNGMGTAIQCTANNKEFILIAIYIIGNFFDNLCFIPVCINRSLDTVNPAGCLYRLVPEFKIVFIITHGTWKHRFRNISIFFTSIFILWCIRCLCILTHAIYWLVCIYRNFFYCRNIFLYGRIFII